MMVNFLTTPGAAMTVRERLFLNTLAEDVAERFACPLILNIGVEYGASIHCFHAGAPEAEIIGIDLNNSKMIANPGAALITADSTADSTQRLLEGEISLLLVDGGHTHDVVLQDATKWGARVAVGGVIVFHDYTDIQTMEILKNMIKGVRPAVDEWFQKVTRYDWDELPAPDSMKAWRRVG